MTQPKTHAAYLLTGVIAALSLAACGGHSFTPASASMQSSVTHPLALDEAQVTVPNVSGTYDGSISETASGHTVTGTVTLTIHQTGSAFKGPAQTTINKRTRYYTLSGTVSAITGGAKLTFTIKNPKGEASAHATVYGKHLNGKAYVPPSGSEPAVYIKYKTVKQ